MKTVLVQAFQLEGLPARKILPRWPDVAGRDAFADEFEDPVFEGSAIDELGLGAVVIVGGGDRETDLIARKEAFGNGEVKLVAEHFSGDRVTVGFETEGNIVDFAVASGLLPDPDTVDIGCMGGNREEQETHHELCEWPAHQSRSYNLTVTETRVRGSAMACDGLRRAARGSNLGSKLQSVS